MSPLDRTIKEVIESNESRSIMDNQALQIVFNSIKGGYSLDKVVSFCEGRIKDKEINNKLKVYYTTLISEAIESKKAYYDTPMGKVHKFVSGLFERIHKGPIDRAIDLLENYKITEASTITSLRDNKNKRIPTFK